MNSYIFKGKVMHARRDTTHGVYHKFVYAVFMLLLDLDDLPALDRSLPLFGHNRRALVSLHDCDHLPHPDDPTRAGGFSLKESARARLAAAGTEIGPSGKVYLLTNPRIFGYTFNPLSVYYLYDGAGCLAGGLAEVSNTFGDMHPYVMNQPLAEQNAEERRYDMRRYAADKVLYVSPWIPMDARYELSWTPIREQIIVHIDEFRGEERFFQARLWGRLSPLTARGLRGVLWRYPLMTFKVTAAIHYEGVRTHLKGAPFLRRKHAYAKRE
jgi:hypothetical protein